MPRVTGQVISWKDTYGFVSAPEDEQAVFFHVSDVEKYKQLWAGSIISYTLAIDPKNGKPRAFSCRLEEGANSAWAPTPPDSYCGVPVTDIIQVSKWIMKVLRHDNWQQWLTADEIQARVPQGMQMMVRTALDFDAEQPTQRKHFKRKERVVEEFQVIHDRPRQGRSAPSRLSNRSRSRSPVTLDTELDYDVPT
jgi:cold shock CspA family protein